MIGWRQNRQGLRPVLCIAGPTASGKSGAAIKLAKAVDGEIINADSMQVYADLQIISARPTQAEIEDIPHHLFGHIDGAVRYSTGAWLRDAEAKILDVLAQQKTPIIVGGTGLYFKALLRGLADIPEPTAQATQNAQHILEQDGITALRESAERQDPVAAEQVLGDDPQRLLRIVAVARGTAKPLSQWQTETRPIIPPGEYCAVRLLPARQVLYERINTRFDAMVQHGARLEAQALMARELSAALPVTKAIGVRELASENEDGIARAKQQSRRYAKRQYTWFNNQTPDWPVAQNSDQAVLILEKFFRNMTLT